MTATPFEARSCWEVLEIPAHARDEEIRSAYRRLMKRYHPDRAKTSEERVKLHVKAVEINAAYEECRQSARVEPAPPVPVRSETVPPKPPDIREPAPIRRQFVSADRSVYGLGAAVGMLVLAILFFVDAAAKSSILVSLAAFSGSILAGLILGAGTGFLDLCLLSGINVIPGSDRVPEKALLVVLAAFNTWLIYFSFMRDLQPSPYGLSLFVLKAVAAYTWVFIYALSFVAERVKFQLARNITFEDV